VAVSESETECFRALDCIVSWYPVAGLKRVLAVHGELQKAAQFGGFDALISSPEYATPSSYSSVGSGTLSALYYY